MTRRRSLSSPRRKRKVVREIESSEDKEKWNQVYRKALKDYGHKAQAERIATAALGYQVKIPKMKTTRKAS